MSLHGKVALVTGGADGIGKALADVFLGNSAQGVFVVDINEEKGQDTMKILQDKHGSERVRFMKCDVACTEQLEAAFKDCMDYFGQLDIVCNNAGICNEFKRKETIAINLMAVIEGTYLAVKYMGTQNGGQGGVVVNTSSIGGLFPFRYAPVYAASKHGVTGFTRSVAVEPDVVTNGIRVVAICPDVVDTTLVRNSVAGVKYKEEQQASLEKILMIQVHQVASTVLRLIEDTSANGSTVLIRFGQEDKDIPPTSLD